MKTLSVAVVCVLCVVAASSCGREPLVEIPGGISAQLCSTTTGRLAAGATVTAHFDRPSTGQAETRTATADAQGFVHFADLPATTVRLDVRLADDFESSFPHIAVTPGEDTQVVDTACHDRPGDRGTGSVDGDICNRHTGGVVRDAEVSVDVGDGTRVSTHTDANGHFLLAGVPVGPQTIVVRSPTYHQFRTVDVVQDQTVPFDDAPSGCTAPDPLTTGTVVGSICGTTAPGDPGGPLGDVHVSLVDPVDGRTYEDFTLPDGTFAIAGIPVSDAGVTVDVTAQKGPFVAHWSGVHVLPLAQSGAVDLTVSSGCEPLSPDLDQQLLVVQGFYDHIESAVARMGFVPDLVQGNPDDFHDWSRDAFGTREFLEAHKVVFVNCGVDPSVWEHGLSEAIKANIKHFVEQGGTLYVSDWSYPLVEQVWPEKINFLGDDLTSDGAEHGVGETTYHARITDAGLADYEGANDIDVVINFAAFAVMSEVAPDVSTFLQADEQYWLGGTSPVRVLANAPMTVRFNDGRGKVVFTSFHQEQDSSATCTADSECAPGLSCDGEQHFCVAPVDGPEDLVLRYLVFSL